MRSNYSNSSVALIATLLLLPIVYVGSYPLAMRPLEIWFDPNIDGVGSEPEIVDGHYASYFGGSSPQRIGEIVYWPIHYLDRQWRPDYWEGKEYRQFKAFLDSLPTGPDGTKVLDLSSGTFIRPALDRWQRFVDRIGKKLFWKVTIYDFRAESFVAIVEQVRWMILGEPAADDFEPSPESTGELANDRQSDVLP